MKALPSLILCLVPALVVGCAQTKPQSSQPPETSSPASVAGAPAKKPAKADRAAQPPTLIVTPEMALTGKVAMVNLGARFVVLNFPIGRLPALEQILAVCRKGLKVGEVKVSGPQRDDNIVADITTGEAEVGDEVRDR